MGKSLYNFADVEAKTASPATTNRIIKDLLRSNDNECYSDMERFLRAPGVSGSRAFDQAYAVGVLMQHDEVNGNLLAKVIESTDMTRRELWDRLQRVLRTAGFVMKHGRLIGIIPEAEGEDDDGQPDID